MIYGSLCSGIEAATQAFHPLGWTPAFFSEIEKFPSAVLAHHYPTVPNHGDMTKFQDWPDHAIDILVGGTPCQSFSVAGLRKGLADPRGNLMLTFGAVAQKYQPRWILRENVPGVLSSNGGRDFGTFLGMLAELGYGFAYRVLDAQYVRVGRFARAVPQRRRRVFVVGHLGDWRRAAAVLFDRESLSGHPAPRREAGQNAATTISARPTGGGGQSDLDGGLIYAPPVVPQAMSSKWSKGFSGPAGDEVANLVAHALRGEGFDASEDGTGRGTPLVPVAPTLRSGGNSTGGNRPYGTDVDTCDSLIPVVAGTLKACSGKSGIPNGAEEVDRLIPVAIQERAVSENTDAGPQPWAVRRLTPVECERLQGFPDGFTRIPYRGKPADRCPDGPRYKALGNSMAVNVMAWIGERIALVDAMEEGE